MYTKRMLRELTYQIVKMFYQQGGLHIIRQLLEDVAIFIFSTEIT